MQIIGEIVVSREGPRSPHIVSLNAAYFLVMPEQLCDHTHTKKEKVDIMRNIVVVFKRWTTAPALYPVKDARRGIVFPTPLSQALTTEKVRHPI